MKYYCIGIKGTGMATLACMLYDMGNTVSGYDDAKDYKFTEKGLRERGIEIFYDSTHPLDKDTIVTASKAFNASSGNLSKPAFSVSLDLTKAILSFIRALKN